MKLAKITIRYRCDHPKQFIFSVGVVIEVSLFQRLSFIDVATGSLGQGLSCAAGMAYVGKYIDKVMSYSIALNAFRYY